MTHSTTTGTGIVNTNSLSSTPRVITQVVLGSQIGGVEHHIVSLINSIQSQNIKFNILCGLNQVEFFKASLPSVDIYSLGNTLAANIQNFKF